MKDQQGNDGIIAYQVFINDGVDGSAFTIIMNASTPGFNNFNVLYSNGVVAGKTYQIKYRAQNSFGFGEFSPVGTIFAAQLTDAVGPIKIYNVDKTVVVEWVDTFEDYGYPISSYNVLFVSYEGQY